MNKSELLAILNSDMKLWEKAATEPLGNSTLKKTINLPFGIGDYTVTLEGLTDAKKRRDALQSYGGHIRSVVHEYIDDDAIAARAAASAAKSSYDSGEQSDTLYVPDKDRRPEREATTSEGPVQAHVEDGKEPPSERDVLIARASRLRDRIHEREQGLKQDRRSLRAAEAALAVFDEDEEDDSD